MSSITVSSYALRGSNSVSRGRFALIGLATVVASVLANVVFYFLAGTVVDYHPDFPPLANASGTNFFTTFFAIGAVLVYAGLRRWTRNPARNFTIVSAVVLALSIIPDLTIIPPSEGASNGQTTVLILQHVVAATVIVWMLTNLTRSRAR